MKIFSSCRLGLFSFIFIIICWNICAENLATYSRINRRFIGGSRARIGDFPFIMAIFYKNRFHGSFSLITPQTAIGVAHLLFNREIRDLHGRVGSINKFVGSVVYFKRKILHPESDRTTINNDIALLTLESSVDHVPNVLPIALPNENMVFNTGIAMIAGWGKIGTAITNKYLSEAVVTLIDPKPYKNYFNQTLIGKEILTKSNYVRTGPSDSGTPLVYTDNSGKQILIGVLAGGGGEQFIEAPDIYMSISCYIDFIKANSVGQLVE